MLEIYPRLLTGPVTKSSAQARQTYLAERYPGLECQTEDAFDAAVSALVMARRATELAALPAALDAEVRREGWIWEPGLTALAPLGTLDSWPSPLLSAR